MQQTCILLNQCAYQLAYFLNCPSNTLKDRPWIVPMEFDMDAAAGTWWKLCSDWWQIKESPNFRKHYSCKYTFAACSVKVRFPRRCDVRTTFQNSIALSFYHIYCTSIATTMAFDDTHREKDVTVSYLVGWWDERVGKALTREPDRCIKPAQIHTFRYWPSRFFSWLIPKTLDCQIQHYKTSGDGCGCWILPRQSIPLTLLTCLS